MKRTRSNRSICQNLWRQLSLVVSLLVGISAMQPTIAEMPEKAWGNVSNGFSLSVQAQKNEFKSGEKIMLSIYLKNASDQTITIQLAWPYEDLQPVVHDSHGKVVPLTESGEKKRQQKPRIIIGSTRKPFTPHEEVLLAEGCLDDFDLSIPGTYTVAMKWRIPKSSGEGSGEILSNTISITITN